MEQDWKLEEKKQKHFRETFDRLTAVSHVQDEHFSEHKKIEGYYEHPVSEKFFGKDRLLKRENMFGVIQLGYDPDREKLFLFAHMKTSRYDTAANRYQKEMKEYGQKGLLRRQGQNLAYVSRRQEMAAVLIEKGKVRPWTKRIIKAHMNRNNMETVRKLLPFFSREEETEELSRLRKQARERQQEIRDLQVLPLEAEEVREEMQEKKARHDRLLSLRKEYVSSLITENLLHTMLAVKDAEAGRFLTRINHAWRYQRTEIEAYYQNRRKGEERASENRETAEDASEDERR